MGILLFFGALDARLKEIGVEAMSWIKSHKGQVLTALDDVLSGKDVGTVISDLFAKTGVKMATAKKCCADCCKEVCVNAAGAIIDVHNDAADSAASKLAVAFTSVCTCCC